jgi:hypothetical protein
MIEIERIKEAVKTLNEEEYIQFRQWFSERDRKRWNDQIEKDSASGKLDFLIEDAMEAKRNRKLKDL